MTARLAISLLLLFMFAAAHAATATAAESGSSASLRQMIAQLKENPRGPFVRVQWYCNDGSVFPPAEGACREHGGGIQYGKWNKTAVALRAQGYLLANVLAALELSEFIGDEPRLDDLRQILLERYLIRADDGWVFRSSRFGYRGALQIENEEDAASKLVYAMLSDSSWTAPERFLLLRESVRLLPISVKPRAAEAARQLATDIAEVDEAFLELRVKIHSMPDSRDATRVREYMSGPGMEELQPAYEELANELDALYGPKNSRIQLQALAEESANKQFKREIAKTMAALDSADGIAEAMAVTASRAAAFRSILLSENRYTVYNRLRFLRASLILEQEAYVLGNQLLHQQKSASRMTQLQWLGHLAEAVFAAGLISERQLEAIDHELRSLIENPALNVTRYYSSLRYLSRLTQWTQCSLEFHFGAVTSQWQALTALSQNFVPDRLRSSPLLPFTRILDRLIHDASQLSGIRHHLFGRQVASGLRALNPGLRRGVLLLPPAEGEQLRTDGIYILASTRQELTPVAGILTRGEGSSVSHVQLLARNLGIPNLVISDQLFEAIKPHIGKPVIVAVSHRGVVNIESDGKQWYDIFDKGKESKDVTIKVDENKLDLSDTSLKSLSEIRAGDSGRTVGPKTANLGELMYYYPNLVNPGVAIPFGVFRSLLDQPMVDGGASAFDWMKAEYKRLDNIRDEKKKQRHTALFLAHLRHWITHSDPGQAFRDRLREKMKKEFGDEGSYGVFVRSDTNVEDLPEFTGAGLNLTLPNVVGFDAVIDAILRVWASPFTDRSYAWRQSLMYAPEHVYPAVLLMKSFASEKSGVMITSDVDSGDRSWLSVAVNEGIGGAVEGQAAEEIRVQRMHLGVKLMAQASAAQKAVLNPAGGITSQPASGNEYVLNHEEITHLISLAHDVERRFPLPRGSDRLPVVADIEFGFRDGQLALFQIRSFVESHRARHNQTLIEMDRQWHAKAKIRVHLDKAPLQAEGVL